MIRLTEEARLNEINEELLSLLALLNKKTTDNVHTKLEITLVSKSFVSLSHIKSLNVH